MTHSDYAVIAAKLDAIARRLEALELYQRSIYQLVQHVIYCGHGMTLPLTPLDLAQRGFVLQSEFQKEHANAE